jgi:hypothetical protein
MVCAMKKAGVLSILFAVTLLTVGVIAEAQQPKKVRTHNNFLSFLFFWQVLGVIDKLH